MQPLPRIENWCITTWDGQLALPTHTERYIHGYVYGDDRFDDGSDIRTSTVITINPKDMTAKTLNTLYQLGEMNKVYENHLIEEGIDTTLLV